MKRHANSSILKIGLRLLSIGFILYSLIISCDGVVCDSLPNTYTSYEEAIGIIESAKFKQEDKVNTSKSSWIRGASFYSCDGITGYFIIETDSKKYIHSGIPVKVWQGFKKADSFGSYYNKNIKNRYQFKLK